MPRIRARVRRSFRAPFVRAADERSLEAACLRRVEIKVVARNHATLAGIELQILGARQVGLGQQLVLADCLARDDGVPAQAVALGRIHDDPETQDREGHAIELLAQLRQRAGEVRPAFETVNRVPTDAAAVLRGEHVQTGFGDELLQRLAMHVVEVHDRRRMLAVVQHSLERAPPKLVGECRPVLLHAVPGASRRQGGTQARVPVENGSAGVECQRLDATGTHNLVPSVLWLVWDA